MRRPRLVWLAVAVSLAGCGGDDVSPFGPGADTGASPVVSAGIGEEQPDPAEPPPGGPPPDGPAGTNEIRIGGQAWQRTLPMTTGQCFLYEDDGTLPTSAVVWGTLDGNDEVGFSASVKQDGTFGAEVRDEAAGYWYAGPNTPAIDDLVIELDFDAQRISGSGTFYNVATGESAAGSFVFRCIDDREEEPPPPAYGPVVTEPVLLRWEGSDISGPTSDTTLAVDDTRQLWIRGGAMQYLEDGRSVICSGIEQDEPACFAQESQGTLLASGWYGDIVTEELPGARVDQIRIAGRDGTCLSVEFGDGASARSCTDNETQVQLLYESTGRTLTGAATYQLEELVEWSVPAESDFRIPEAAREALAG